MSSDWLMAPGLPFWPDVPWWVISLAAFAIGALAGYLLRILRPMPYSSSDA